MGPKTVHGGVFGVEGGRDTLGLGLPALLDNLPFTRQFCSPNPQTFYIRYWRNYIYWTLVLYLLKRAARTPPGHNSLKLLLVCRRTKENSKLFGSKIND
jgi:hypothetical protein